MHYEAMMMDARREGLAEGFVEGFAETLAKLKSDCTFEMVRNFLLKNYSNEYFWETVGCPKAQISKALDEFIALEKKFGTTNLNETILAIREARDKEYRRVIQIFLREGFSEEELMQYSWCTQEQFLQAKRELDATAMVSEKN